VQLHPTPPVASRPHFHLKKGLDHLDAVGERFQTIIARFAGFHAQGPP
jgi:hypothetical protein